MATPHTPETPADAREADRPDGPVVVIGGGPAGLTAAYRLAQAGDPVVVLEQDAVLGGISRTVERDGWRFDIGGHRFFTKVVPVEEFWHEILPDEDFLLRPRMSRIFYGGKYYDYPIKLGNALSNLGVVEAVRCGLSFLWVRVRPPKDLSTLEGYIVSNYGWRLYHHFFKTYNEKVWGVSAVRAVGGLGCAAHQGHVAVERRVGTDPLVVRTSARPVPAGDQPHRGIPVPEVRPGDDVGAVRRAGRRPRRRGPHGGVGHHGAPGGRPRRGRVGRARPAPPSGSRPSHVISSMPFTALARAVDPPVPAEVLRAADDLHYRDFLTVALVVPAERGFPDNWIYIHSPDVKVGRIQNFGSWSPVPGEGRADLPGPGVLRVRGRRAVDDGATTTWWPWAPRSWPPSAWSTRPTSRRATWSGCRRPTPSTTTPTGTTSR